MTLGAVRSKRTLAGLAVLFTGAAGWQAPAGEAAVAPTAQCATSVPFRSGTSGYHTFRIPAVLRIGKSTVLAFAEGRRNSASDEGDIDVVLRRSLDGGCTWQPMRVIARGGGQAFGNPTPVADPKTGRIVLLICRTVGNLTKAQLGGASQAVYDARQVWELHSDSGGGKWSAPRQITKSVKPDNWRWYATGPGHAIALRSGPHAGRLLVPANHTAVVDGEVVHGAHALYSDDHGRTWHIGFVEEVPGGWINLNETSLAELPDGRIYINSRDDGGFSNASRANAYSTDGGESVEGSFEPQEALEGPEVQGSVLQLPGGPLVYSGPSDPGARAAMALRTSNDGGIYWEQAWLANSHPAAYSDLVDLGGGTVGLLYETGTTSPYETLTFNRLTS
ncbi:MULTISPECIES: exo-alpha-sialidase [unclassified Streptomyces]|uniref:sialidase family protein n=1 Tax=unclassified Streptomyces TaxID=2593676 RepID=UPI00381B63B0